MSGITSTSLINFQIYLNFDIYMILYSQYIRQLVAPHLDNLQKLSSIIETTRPDLQHLL